MAQRHPAARALRGVSSDGPSIPATVKPPKSCAENVDETCNEGHIFIVFSLSLCGVLVVSDAFIWNISTRYVLHAYQTGETDHAVERADPAVSVKVRLSALAVTLITGAVIRGVGRPKSV